MKAVFWLGIMVLMQISRLRFKLVDAHETVAHQPGVPLWGLATVCWCSITFFSPFQSLFKLSKISINSMFTPALR